MVLISAAGAVVLWAIFELRRWTVENDPGHRRTRDALAAGRIDEAAAELERWVEREPQSAEAQFLKARIALRLDRIEEAATALRRAYEWGHPRDETQRLEAALMAQTSRIDQAEPLLRRAQEAQLGPEPEITAALARIAMARYNFTEAIRQIERWSQVAPWDARPYILRIELLRRSDSEAGPILENCLKALELDPESAQARLMLAEQLQKSHRIAEAAQEIATYRKQRPDDPHGHALAGRIALEAHDFAAAIAALDQGLALDPKNPDLLKARAQADIQSRKLDEAVKRLEEAIVCDPFDMETQKLLGQALSGLGQPDRARQALAKAEQLRKDEDALSELRRKVQKNPRDLESGTAIARWLFDHGRPKEGEMWAHRILGQRSDFAPAHQLLADHYEKTQQQGLANYHRLMAGGKT